MAHSFRGFTSSSVALLLWVCGSIVLHSRSTYQRRQGTKTICKGISHALPLWHLGEVSVLFLSHLGDWVGRTEWGYLARFPMSWFMDSPSALGIVIDILVLPMSLLWNYTHAWKSKNSSIPGLLLGYGFDIMIVWKQYALSTGILNFKLGSFPELTLCSMTPSFYAG